jgi:predicted DCC family thiol-disulfide oxidoreductase YuxK
MINSVSGLLKNTDENCTINTSHVIDAKKGPWTGGWAMGDERWALPPRRWLQMSWGRPIGRSSRNALYKRLGSHVIPTCTPPGGPSWALPAYIMSMGNVAVY